MNIKKILLISGLILNGSLLAQDCLGGLGDISEIVAQVYKTRPESFLAAKNIPGALLLRAYLQGFKNQKFKLTGLSYAEVVTGKKPEILKAAYDLGMSKAR